jgi:hypothetical protein
MFLLALLIIGWPWPCPGHSGHPARPRSRTYRAVPPCRAALLPKFSIYPPNIEALVKTNNIRFLRKKYVDPITKDDWKPVMLAANSSCHGLRAAARRCGF